MRNLSIITDNSPEEIYLGIASSKNSPCRDILFLRDFSVVPNNCIQGRVLDRYKEYKDNVYSLENISGIHFAENEKECLKNCYSSATVSMDWLYNRTLEIQDQFIKDKCPYCGINSPSTRDHYLPKELFPEFAILSYNLIPCCDDCNRLKGQRWTDQAGKRIFIHFYFDEIPNEIFMNAQISLSQQNAPLIDMSLSPPQGYTNPFYDLLSSHVHELNVLERIEHQVTSYVSEIYQKNMKCLDAGLDDLSLKRLLSIDINNLETNHGKNYWKAVVCRGIINCDDFFRVAI